MTELAHTAGLPDTPDNGGRAPSFLALAGRVAALTTSAFALTEGLGQLRRRMEHDADDADQLAEQAAAAEVDPHFLGLVHEAARALRAVATVTGEAAAAADQMAHASQGMDDAHNAEYRGVYEAVQASGYQQPKPGFLRAR
ncbi:conjugal transfer protein TraB [Streptomyces filamentosus]|uniref:conjugal transfer protein TraB n=1 Tax=Streptomyces filamentosus TaxID=67294 RepID=UPI00332FA3CF